MSSLAKYSFHQLERAFTRTFDECKFLPHLADIVSRIETAPKYQMPPWEQPVKFQPFSHECCPEGTKIRDTGAYRLLKAVNPYEGAHIACPGERFSTRCPNCGSIQQPYLNPFIASLMDRFPQETKGWNPWHKGHVLCADCNEKINSEWKAVPGIGWDAHAYTRASLETGGANV